MVRRRPSLSQELIHLAPTRQAGGPGIKPRRCTRPGATWSQPQGRGKAREGGRHNMIGLSALGVFLLGIGAWMLWRKKSKKVVTWMWLVAGFSLGGGIAATMANVFGAAGGVGGHLFGVGAGVVLGTIAIIMLLELWHGAHPKKG